MISVDYSLKEDYPSLLLLTPLLDKELIISSLNIKDNKTFQIVQYRRKDHDSLWNRLFHSDYYYWRELEWNEDIDMKKYEYRLYHIYYLNYAEVKKEKIMNATEYILHNQNKDCQCTECLKYNINSLKLEIECWKNKSISDNTYLIQDKHRIEQRLEIKELQIKQFLEEFPQFYKYFRDVAIN